MTIGGTEAMKHPAVYIMANQRNGALYTGVTSDLVKRAWEHRQVVTPGFTSRYRCKILVWWEYHETMVSAITREKQIKGGSRQRKLHLIETQNSNWRDLYGELQ